MPNTRNSSEQNLLSLEHSTFAHNEDAVFWTESDKIPAISPLAKWL